ncbi:MAG: 4Fe-4S dicluster domain-containing protein [Nitrospirota bacterium]|nr:4Fe-4S dicluster domain-containing protein [Nitrospirota bacterium]
MPDSDLSNQPSSNPSLGRRTFLRHSAISIGATVHEFVKHRDAPSPIKKEPPVSEKTGWLRPPGAVVEKLFLERCTGCADCVEVCPHDAIQALSSNGTPVIYPEESPCQLCEDLPCIKVCETEALLPVAGRFQVNMGVAKVWSKMCTAGNGCNACVSKCPTEALSMDFALYDIHVDEAVCVGCGVCQYICGTVNDRTAIRIVPR